MFKRCPLLHQRIFNLFSLEVSKRASERSSARAHSRFFDVFIRRSLMDHRCIKYVLYVVVATLFLLSFFLSFSGSHFLKYIENKINCKQHSSLRLSNNNKKYHVFPAMIVFYFGSLSLSMPNAECSLCPFRYIPVVF